MLQGASGFCSLVTVLIFGLWSKLDHVVDSEDGNGSFGGKFQTLQLANGWLKNTCILAVSDQTFNQIQSIPATMHTMISEERYRSTHTHHLSPSLSDMVCEALWKARSLETRSVESSAAFTDKVFGITRRELANSATASCSREVWRQRK